MLTGVSQNPDHLVKKKPHSLWEGAKYLASKAWENRESIANLAMQAAPFLLAEDGED